MDSTIVYRQSELDAAIAAGAQRITLCAGIFNIPKTHNVSFDRIGPVKVFVQCSRREADDAGMKFERIYPQFKPEYGIDTRESMAVVGAVSSGSGSYGSGSYYGSGSGSGSSSSFAASFRLSGSFGSGVYGSGWSQASLAARPCSLGSCLGSFAVLPDSNIRVYGYGINLI